MQHCTHDGALLSSEPVSSSVELMDIDFRGQPFGPVPHLLATAEMAEES